MQMLTERTILEENAFDRTPAMVYVVGRVGFRGWGLGVLKCSGHDIPSSAQGSLMGTKDLLCKYAAPSARMDVLTILVLQKYRVS